MKVLNENKKWALVTGASGGVGKEIAKILAGKGWNLVLVARSENKLVDLSKELTEANSVNVKTFSIDLASENASVKVFDFCKENSIVVDTFGGSGSTLMACEGMNRICYTIELDEKYASVILRRYVEDTGNADGVFVVRDGKQIPYADLVKEVQGRNSNADSDN